MNNVTTVPKLFYKSVLTIEKKSKVVYSIILYRSEARENIELEYK